MVQQRSILIGLDNTGLIKARCFHVIGKKNGTIGSRIITSAKKLDSSSEWKRGDIRRGVVVLVKKETQRKTGFVLTGPYNAILVMSKKWEPLGTRVNATLPKELRNLGYMKLVAIANMLV